VLGAFATDFGTRMVYQITGRDIEGWMGSKDWTMRTRLNCFSDVRNLMGFAVRKGYRPTNPVLTIDKPSVDKEKSGILTPEQAAAPLVACDGSEPDMLPAVAIGLFAGARTAEIEKMQWKHIDFADRTIEIPEEGKTGARYITMSDNLRSWLLPHAGRHWIRRAAEVVRLSPGRTTQGREDRELAQERVAPRFRHHYAQHENATQTAAELGHEDSTRTQAVAENYLALPNSLSTALYLRVLALSCLSRSFSIKVLKLAASDLNSPMPIVLIIAR
jgi:integrase